METFLQNLANVNDGINTFIWVTLGLFLLLGTGILTTLITGFFQITHLKHWWEKTGGGIFRKDVHSKADKSNVSQFQALCTALAATIGTGNLAGVAAAICLGGPGAIFWMWVAAFFGMMTNYSENVLGIYFRRRDVRGEWCGGAMYYLKDGLGKLSGYEKIGNVLAILFSCFAILASFGIGNLGQVNKIVKNVEATFFAGSSHTVLWGEGANQITSVSLGIGIVLMLIGFCIILGGLRRIASVTEKLVPFMAIVYILGGIIICIMHIKLLPAAFLSIFRFAFGVKAVAGAAAGIAIKNIITGLQARRIFQRGWPWLLRHGPLKLKRQGACQARAVGHLRSIRGHACRLHNDGFAHPDVWIHQFEHRPAS